jgi:predicted Fe-Mo cluster-binding NifX family protein
MKVCFPVQQDEGMESKVYNHFGSAPLFVVVDTATDDITLIANRDQRHERGSCNPIAAIANHKVDVVVVGGIGSGALSRLNATGIRVFRSTAPSIRENISMFLAAQLQECTLQQCCGGRYESGECAH